MYQNAKKYFFTAHSPITASQLIAMRLPELNDPALPITSGGVWLDKYRMSDPDLSLKKGDTLRVYLAATQGNRYSLPASHIILESEDICVVYKPPGISTAADRSNLFYNLTEGVRAYYAASGNRYSPTPITRLDYMVQGLCLFAKHKEAEKELFKLTKARQITKHYMAILPVRDNTPKKLLVTHPLTFTDKARVDSEGKPAKTLFIRQSQLTDSLSTYLVKLFTGRRHQIRAHAAKELRPLIGDGMYGSRWKHKHQHIGLVAYKYIFNCLGKPYRIVLPNPLEHLHLDDFRGR